METQTEIEIITLQQEVAYEFWQEAKRDNEYEVRTFWEWYWYYCLENGFYNDK